MTNLNKKISTLLLITVLIISNVSTIFADTDSIDNYRILEYIESSGTQYIDTGISPASYLNTLVIQADMQYTSVPTGSSTQSYLFGTGYYSSTSSNRKNIVMGYRGATSTSSFAMLNGGQLSDATTISGASLDANRHIFTISQPEHYYQIDDRNKTFSSTITSNLTANLLIFAGRATGSSGNNVNYYSSARLYSFKIYNNTVLIRDFVPVERLSDSKVGLYDLINDQFYTNSGTGNFTAGYQTTYQVNTSVSPSGAGLVSGGGTGFSYGQSCTLTATPNTGYQFREWSDGSTSNPYTFNVYQTVNITAVFDQITIYYNVTTSVSPSNSGYVSGSGQYEDGSTVTLTATPNEGYVFKEWSDGVIYPTRSFTITDNVNLTAYFEEEASEYDVTLNVYPSDSGTTTGSGTYEPGETVTIEAIPEDGYEFVSWSDGNIANPRNITVNSTINLTANFRLISEPIDNNEQLTMLILLVSFLILVSFGKGVNYD